MLACGVDGDDDAWRDLDAGTLIDATLIDATLIDATPNMPPSAASVGSDSEVVASGTCAVVGSSRIEVPTDFGSYPTIWRLLGGFVVSAGQRCTAYGGDQLFALASGTTSRLLVPSGGGVGLCSVPVADHSTDPALIVTNWSGGQRTTGLLDALTATAWRGSPPVPGAAQTIGEAYFRGTAQHDGAPSFDGKRAIITSGHVAVDPPDAIMVGIDGKRIGQVASLGLADRPSFNCLTVTPTDHGAAVSVLDTDADPVFRLVELGADGAVVQTIVHPAAQQAGCPLVVSSPTAIVVALTRADGSSQVVELSAGQVHELPVPSGPTGTPRWISKTAGGGLLWLESTEERTLRMLHVSAAGTTRLLAADLGSASVLPGETGRLFLIRALTSGTQPIDEIACAPEGH